MRKLVKTPPCRHPYTQTLHKHAALKKKKNPRAILLPRKMLWKPRNIVVEQTIHSNETKIVRISISRAPGTRLHVESQIFDDFPVVRSVWKKYTFRLIK